MTETVGASVAPSVYRSLTECQFNSGIVNLTDLNSSSVVMFAKC